MFDDDPRWGSDPRGRDNDTRDREAVDPRDVDVRDASSTSSTCRADSNASWSATVTGEYTLRGSESRTLSIVGAFRVVSSRDLRDHDNRTADPRKGDLRHLREQGLVRTVPLHGHRDHAVVLTDRGAPSPRISPSRSRQ